MAPPQVSSEPRDPELPALALAQVGDVARAAGRPTFMSNSFAFGGNNASLVFGGGA
jgi:3-oxoacyl-[acyl-carrier-protein] synthase-1